ncbi:MAG: hypothetical protein ABR509_01200 [Candidatus Limnocylindria bacterium]
MTRRGWIGVAVAGILVAWAVLLVALLAGQRGESHAVGYAFAAVVALAGVAFAVTFVSSSRVVQAIGACAAGCAVAVVGVLGGATVGAPLIPIGVGMVIFAMVAAETSRRPQRTYLLCVGSAIGTAPLVAALALAGRLMGL